MGCTLFLQCEIVLSLPFVLFPSPTPLLSLFTLYTCHVWAPDSRDGVCNGLKWRSFIWWLLTCQRLPAEKRWITIKRTNIQGACYLQRSGKGVRPILMYSKVHHFILSLEDSLVIMLVGLQETIHSSSLWASLQGGLCLLQVVSTIDKTLLGQDQARNVNIRNRRR